MYSIAIPFYNEEKNAETVVSGLVAALNKNKINYELILVINGSLDNTPSILRKLNKKYKRTKIVEVYPNQGFGWGILNGMKAAKGDVVGYMCGDGQTAPETLINVIKKFENENLDFCQIKRIKRDDGLKRRFLSKCFNLMYQNMFEIPTSDIGGNPKIMKRGLFKKLNIKSKDFFIEAELLIKLGKLNPRVGEVPIEFKKRRHGKSDIKFSTVYSFTKNAILYKLNG